MTDADWTGYRSFGRDEWALLRAATPLSLAPSDLEDLRSLNDRLDMAEVSEVYLPLSRLLNLRVAATQALVSGASEDERTKLFSANAKRIWGL